jgi:hypothetical protein
MIKRFTNFAAFYMLFSSNCFSTACPFLSWLTISLLSALLARPLFYLAKYFCMGIGVILVAVSFMVKNTLMNTVV